ncbi:sensor histidine kinase [Parafilimonas sp.]|uniref:sensor histidine kinase n=1 Tax=Parafilimonas sp. TaxID=1969739 RepID=UPI0039E3024F
MASAASILFSAKPPTSVKKDRAVKLIAVPVLAVAIANITQIITNNLYSFLQLSFIYTYFIALGWLIWEGNIRLLIFLKNNLWLPYREYYKTVLALYGFIILYTSFIATGGLFLWLNFSKEDSTSYAKICVPVIVIVITALFITNLYEMFYLKEQQQDMEKRAEQLNIAKTHAELVALKNQIDPHFLFNSLNTLSYLISSDPLNARLYNDTLAKVYRYILVSREKNLVPAADELEFLSNFFYLLRIRFGKAINMIIEIKSLTTEKSFLPPISLQILLENAIKHNEASSANPLSISVTLFSNNIVIRNRIIKKTYAQPSTGTGLHNLDNRYKLLTGRNIIVYKNNDYFTVKLPFINPQI